MATNSFDNFTANINAVKELEKIYLLVTENYPALKSQADEILRAAIVLSVSAFDNFIHDFVREEIVESYLGAGNFNADFLSVSISIECLKNLEVAASNDEKRIILNNEIKKLHQTNTYQSPKSIEYALGLLNINRIWTLISEAMGKAASDIRNELSLIIDRRNKISHEADYDFINFTKFPIDNTLTNNVVVFIESLATSINSLR